MALKDLLVCLDASDRSAVRLRLALDLARRNGSCITALYIRGWSDAQLTHRQTAEFAGRSLTDVQALDDDVEAAIDRAARAQRQELEQLAARHGLVAEWRNLDGDPQTALPQQARYADLCIMDLNTPAQGSPEGYRFSENMPFVAGRPVLFIPGGEDGGTLGRHVAIAWNSSRAAARAIGDALPLLERAEATTILAVNPADYIEAHDAPSLQRLIEHLHRHGVQPKTIQAEHVASERIAGELQSLARDAGADLLIAGAYGHSRLREMLLGGVTRDLLARAQMPVMMSH